MASPLEASTDRTVAPFPVTAPAVKLENSCINNKAVYDYVMRRYPSEAHHLFDDLSEPFASLAKPEVTLTDENTWVPSSLVAKVFENAKIILGDPHCAYKIGFEYITHRGFSYIQKFFISVFTSPQSLLQRVNHINSQFNTTKIVETIWSTPKRAVVRLHWRQGDGLVKDFCEYNRGIYAALPTLWGNPPAEIVESSCYFEGDPYCQFDINYHGRTRGFKRLVDLFQTKKSTLLNALEEIEKDKLLLKEKYDEVRQLNAELGEKVERLKALNEASTLLVSFPETQQIFHKTLSIVVEVLRFDRTILMLVDDTKENLVFSHALGANPKVIERQLKGYSIPLARQENILARVAKRGKPVLIRDVASERLNLENIILSHFKPTSFVICPLTTEDGLLGIVAADRKEFSPPITKSDMDDLSSFMNTMAAALQKARLQERIEANYVNTVSALVRTIEEKDAYTRGHSERVAALSIELGREMGLPEEELQYMRAGCLLHDVGKIGISEAIVRSPKSLTASEYKIIKSHTVKGEEIVRPITFMRKHLFIIRNHHEWWNGKGYPDGLKGEEIPLQARIVALADAYDAITSSRPYKKALPPKEAYKRITHDEGSQYAPDVVVSFKRIFQTKIITK